MYNVETATDPKESKTGQFKKSHAVPSPWLRNSIGMKGIFFSGEAPPIIRDELRYNDKYKDSLQQQI